MRLLPLYNGPQLAAVEGVTPRATDNLCGACNLGLVNNTTCIAPEVFGAPPAPGGILVVAESITRDEDKAGRLGRGKSINHQWLVNQVVGFAKGRPVTLDTALKCHAGKETTDEQLDACRPYLHQTLLTAKPERIIVAGRHAAYAVLGRKPQLQAVRRGYSWLYDAPWAAQRVLEDRTVRPVPVFLAMHPWQVQDNPFQRRWLQEDLLWASTAPVAGLRLPPWDQITHVVQDVADCKLALDTLSMAPWVTFDVETAGRMHSGELEVVSLAIATSDRNGSYVWDRAALACPDVMALVADFMGDPGYAKIAQNAKYDLQAIPQALGFPVRGLRGDTRIWRKTLDSDAAADLETMSELVGMGGAKDEAQAIVEELVAVVRKTAQAAKRAVLKAQPALADVIKGTKNQIELLLSQYGDMISATEKRALWRGAAPRAYVYGKVPTDVLSRYNATDTISTAWLADEFYEQLETQDLMFVWDNLWGPATQALVQVETWGFPVNISAMRLLSKHLDAKLKVLLTRFAVYPGLNPNSNDDVRELLYTKLGLKPLKVSEETGDASTDKDSLDHLKGQHPVVDDLIEWRHLFKLKSQYADGLILHIAPDGRIHTTYNVDGARSGRASSENPNMQNIPSEERDPRDSKLIKDCFVASPGYKLVASDYAQLEFRVAADLSDDPDMKAVFLRGDDFHQATAEFIAPIVWKVTPCPLCRAKGCHVTKAMRRGAKAFNFGIMYGMQDSTIAERAGCDLATARAIRAAVLGKFKKFAAWIAARLAETTKTGLAWTWWMGRRVYPRQLYKIMSQGEHNKGIKINAANSSFNTPVQGTASFYCLASVTKIVNWILEFGIDAKVVATVHDSIVLEVREDLVEQVARFMQETMTGWPTMTGVPLDIDMKVGDAWGSLTTYVLPVEAEAAGLLGGDPAQDQVLDNPQPAA